MGRPRRGGGHANGNGNGNARAVPRTGGAPPFGGLFGVFQPREQQGVKPSTRGGHGQAGRAREETRKIFQASSAMKRQGQIAQRRREPVVYVPEVNLRTI